MTRDHAVRSLAPQLMRLRGITREAAIMIILMGGREGRGDLFREVSGYVDDQEVVMQRPTRLQQVDAWSQP